LTPPLPADADDDRVNPTLLVSALLAPLLFWAAYHYYHDRHRPEPVANLLIAIALGGLASLLAGLGYDLLARFGLRYDVISLASTNVPGLLAYSVLGIGLIEELAKMLPFLLVVLRFRDFDEPLDGIVYASFLALGFATVENVIYLAALTPAEAVARGFAGPAVHIVFASLWGYRIGYTLLTGGNVIRAALAWLAVAALLHGAYDFVVLGYSGTGLVFAALLVLTLWLWRLRVVWRLNARGDGATR